MIKGFMSASDKGINTETNESKGNSVSLTLEMIDLSQILVSLSRQTGASQ